MPFDFKLPDVGEGIAEAEIVKWLVKEGDNVKEDQPVLQIETDKAVVDLSSPKTGVILKINYKDGESVKVGSVLFTVGQAGEKVKSVEKKEEKKVDNNPPRGKSVVGELPEAEDEVEEKPVASVMKGEVQSQKVLASPAIRKMAVEKNINLHDLKGSGEEGRILLSDINKNVPESSVPQQNVPVKREYLPSGYVERIPLKGIRKSIAINMAKSLSDSAQVTMMADAHVQKIWMIREKEKTGFEKKGIKLTLLPFIMRATLTALKEHPLLNASLEGEELILKKYYNMGIAVETEVGLMVPVIKNADHKSIAELAKDVEELALKARERKITPDEMKDSTFSITNYGSYGGKYATPIINPGESAILGIGRVFDHVALNEKNKVFCRKTLPLSLTFDHRIVDGAQAAQFMKTLIMYLEKPEHLLLDIN